ncbi:MAG TPA: alpha/beta fold hydrolase [Nitrospiraceae bacterium]|nr:alpha/beta fold hydrolase [Nitrospiraceae bacterium]
MSTLRAFHLQAADGKRIRGDRADGRHRQILFITGFLSKRWGNKSTALAEWCREKDWGFCCYDVRGFGESEGSFTDYTLSDWIADARLVLEMLKDGPPVTIVGNSLGSWIAWLMAREFEQIERLILIAPAFNMMGVRARSISEERRHAWLTAGWMPWDDDEMHRDFPIAWKWVEESEAYWKTSFDRLRRVKTTILHGLQDAVILPQGSSHFVELLLARDPSFPVKLNLIPGDHRLSSSEHVETFRRIVLEQS